MLGDMTPFRMIGNLYFVGTYKASSHLIDTGDGLILIDTGYEETADVIIESVETLGFNIKDIKIILHSHGHSDHTDGTAKLIALTGAKTYLDSKDIKYIKGFTPDYDYTDGQTISLGNTDITIIKSPGHTEGTVSFFFDVEESGKTYRAGMFGGAGTNQLKKDYLRRRDCSYLNRGMFFETIKKLRNQHVDVMVGNHCWNNDTKGNYEKMLTSEVNPFIDDKRFGEFLDKVERDAEAVILSDSREQFVNYAHRGASEYAPENTFISFYMGLSMGANGIETDVQRTKDGVLVLFHDHTLDRIAGVSGAVADYTLEELGEFTFEKNGLCDKIVVFEDFLRLFAWREITFAIEIKFPGYEQEVVDLIKKYGLRKKTVVTSSNFECIKKVREYAPDMRVGYLKSNVSAEDEAKLMAIGGEEICPTAEELTAEKVHRWHRMGLNVRAWGVVGNRELMKHVYDVMADGTTINYPDELAEYIKSRTGDLCPLP